MATTKIASTHKQLITIAKTSTGRYNLITSITNIISDSVRILANIYNLSVGDVRPIKRRNFENRFVFYHRKALQYSKLISFQSESILQIQPKHENRIL